MVKMLGIIMVLGSSTALGFFEKHKLLTRRKALMKMLDSINIMTRELKFSFIEIPKLIKKLADKSPIGNIFAQIYSEIKKKDGLSIEHKWIKCFKEYGMLIGLAKEDIDIIIKISSVLGKYDVNEQEKALNYYNLQLKNNLDILELKIKNEGNIYKTLGVSIGLVIVIILI